MNVVINPLGYGGVAASQAPDSARSLQPTVLSICGVKGRAERYLYSREACIQHPLHYREAADLPPYVDLNRVLRRGETTAICMAALEKEGPLDTRQLAMRVIRAKGFSETDKVLAQTIALRVVQTLRMRARRGKVESVTRTKGVCIWRIPTGPASW